MNPRESDKILCKISRRTLILRKIRPTNLRNQRKLFFESDVYNPKFKYQNVKRNYINTKGVLKSMTFDNSEIGTLFLKKRAELFRRIELIESIGKNTFSKESIKLFGKPNKYLVAAAKKELEGYQKISEGKKIDFKTCQAEIVKTFEKYGMSDWSVIQKNLVADCARGGNKLMIRHGVRFSKERLKKTIAHEIETHVLRSENGLRQPYEIFSNGTAAYDFTEEGLAIHNENLVSEKKDEKKYWPAAYLVAVNKALTSSFREVYDLMRWYRFSKLRAWVIATKVKRGLIDTSQPGAYTKDYIYYAGKYLVDNFVKSGGDVKELYMGKIGVSDLRYVRKIKGIKKAKYIPKYYK